MAVVLGVQMGTNLVFTENFYRAAKIAAGLGGINLPDKKITLENIDDKESIDSLLDMVKTNKRITTTFDNHDYHFIWSNGIIVELNHKQEDGQNYILKRTDDEEKSHIIENIISELVEKITSQEYNILINATEYNEKGEYIFSSLYNYITSQYLGSIVHKRAIINEFTYDAIRASFSNLKNYKDITSFLKSSGVRAEINMLQPYRTLVPVLQYIKQCKESPCTIIASIDNTLELNLVTRNGHIKYFTQDKAEDILNDFKYFIDNSISIERGQSIKYPTLFNKENLILFLLKNLNVDAFTLHKILYLLHYNGYISFPDVYSNKLKHSEIKTITHRLNSLEDFNSEIATLFTSKNNITICEKCFNDDPNYIYGGIIPTEKIMDADNINNINAQQFFHEYSLELKSVIAKVYKLICYNFLSIILPSAKIKRTKYVLNIKTKNSIYEFMTTIDSPTELGFLILFENESTSQEPELLFDDIGVDIKIKNCYATLASESSILKFMKKWKIGTPTSRYEILPLLIKNGFITKTETQTGAVYYITEKGEQLVQKHPKLTSKFCFNCESSLQNIAMPYTKNHELKQSRICDAEISELLSIVNNEKEQL